MQLRPVQFTRWLLSIAVGLGVLFGCTSTAKRGGLYVVPWNYWGESATVQQIHCGYRRGLQERVFDCVAGPEGHEVVYQEIEDGGTTTASWFLPGTGVEYSRIITYADGGYEILQRRMENCWERVGGLEVQWAGPDLCPPTDAG